MIARLVKRAVREWQAWIAARPTQKRIGQLRARRSEVKSRIEAARQSHDTNALHVLYAQLKAVTTELLRLERRRIA